MPFRIRSESNYIPLSPLCNPSSLSLKAHLVVVIGNIIPIPDIRAFVTPHELCWVVVYQLGVHIHCATPDPLAEMRPKSGNHIHRISEKLVLSFKIIEPKTVVKEWGSVEQRPVLLSGYEETLSPQVRKKLSNNQWSMMLRNNGHQKWRDTLTYSLVDLFFSSSKGLEDFKAIVDKIKIEMSLTNPVSDLTTGSGPGPKERFVQQMMERFRKADVDHDGEITFSGKRHAIPGKGRK